MGLGIDDGDIAVIDRSIEAEHGDIIVADEVRQMYSLTPWSKTLRARIPLPGGVTLSVWNKPTIQQKGSLSQRTLCANITNKTNNQKPKTLWKNYLSNEKAIISYFWCKDTVILGWFQEISQILVGVVATVVVICDRIGGDG